MKRTELRAALKPLADLERLINRIVAIHAQPRDLVALRDSLEQLPNIGNTIKTAEKLPLPKIELARTELELLQSAVADSPPATLQNTGIIRPAYSQELDSVMEASQHAR